MIRIVENDSLSKEEISKQMTEIFKHEEEYWKEGEWVLNKWGYDNPTSTSRFSNYVYVISKPHFEKDSRGICWIYIRVYYIKDFYLYEDERRVRFDIGNDGVKIWNYISVYSDKVCRLTKTKLKTPDKQAIFAPNREEDSKMKFIKDERGMLVPYFGEVI